MGNLAPLQRGATASAVIYLGGVTFVVLAGVLPALRTVATASVEPVLIGMPAAIAIVMLAAAAVIVTVTRTLVAEVVRCKTR